MHLSHEIGALSSATAFIVAATILISPLFKLLSSSLPCFFFMAANVEVEFEIQAPLFEPLFILALQQALLLRHDSPPNAMAEWFKTFVSKATNYPYCNCQWS